MIEDVVFQKIYNEKYVLISLNSNSLKIILALPIKAVIFYMQVTIILIKILKLERYIEIVFEIDLYKLPE